MEECCFEIFPDVLLQQIWPPDRVVEGVRTCWFLRARLPFLVEEAGLSDPETNDWENQLSTALCRFKFERISLYYNQVHAYPISFTAFQRMTIRTKAHKRSIVFEDWVHFHRIQCALKRERERQLSSLNPKLLLTLKKFMPLGLNVALVHLDLSNRAIGVRGAQLLSRILVDCAKLERLDLGGNFIQTEGMALLAQTEIACTELVHLNLRRNHILWNDPAASDLAVFLGKCTRITHLNLRENDVHWQFDDDDLKALIGKCGLLTHLDLGFNSNTSKLGVQTLIAHCPSLTSLDLQSHRMGAAHAASLMELTATCVHLTDLNLSNNDIDADGVHGIAHAVAACSSLRRLDLSHNSLGYRGLSVLAPALAELSHLQLLNLHNTAAPFDAATLLVALLLPASLDPPDPSSSSSLFEPSASSPGARASLTALDLSGNDMTSAEVAELSALLLLRTSSCSLRRLCLGPPDASSSDPDPDSDRSLPRSAAHSLKRPRPGLALAATFVTQRPLCALELRYCGLGREGAGVLGKVVGGWGGWLTSLDLRGNGIGDEGAESLAEGLRQCRPGVRVVRLAENRIGSGAEGVVEACAGWDVLEIDLSENEVDCSVATGVARALRHCRALEKLLLASNQIGEQGSEALLAALDGCGHSLRLLDLNGNLLSLEAAAAASKERAAQHADSVREGGRGGRGRRAVWAASLCEYVAPAWEDEELARTRGKRVKEWQRKRAQAGEKPEGSGMGGHWFALGSGGMGLR